MSRDWEAWLATASGPASVTEEAERDRTEARIKAAVRAHPDIPDSVKIYAKGSYANGTNVRRDADVDIAVEWTHTQIVDTWGETKGLSPSQLGYTPVEERMTPTRFRQLVEEALVTAFGSSAVDTGQDKHIGVEPSPTTLEADVVPCFAIARYDRPGYSVPGIRIFPKSGWHIDNFPKQHKENGIAKNSATNRRYKQIVRCAKRLAQDLHDSGTISQDYPGYLMESMVYNVPNLHFGHTRRLDDMRAVLAFLWGGLRDSDTYQKWTEPNELVYLFTGQPDRKPPNALQVVDAAWDAIGVK